MDKLVWIDIETTGLDPSKDVILEVGAVVTDFHGNALSDVRTWPVGRGDDRYYDATNLGKADHIVGPMHDESGLWNDWGSWLKNGTLNDPKALQYDIVDWLIANDLEPNENRMCGASVHFDRSMLKVHMPHLEGWFHYRNLDFSTIRDLCQKLNPRIFSEMPHHEPDITRLDDMPHRSYHDLKDTILMYRYLVEEFLFVDQRT